MSTPLEDYDDAREAFLLADSSYEVARRKRVEARIYMFAIAQAADEDGYEGIYADAYSTNVTVNAITQASIDDDI